MISSRNTDSKITSANYEHLIQLPQGTAWTEEHSHTLDLLDFSQQHTLDHINCPACNASNDALMGDSRNLAKMTFPDAATEWLLLRAQSTALKPRTHEATRGYIESLKKFFRHLRLLEITPGHLRGYQLARQHNRVLSAGSEHKIWRAVAKPSTVNHELCVLAQILRQARLWHRIKPYYFPLKTPNWSPREILTEEEEERFFTAAARHPEAALAYWVAAITNNTTAAGCELRGLRLKHIFLRDAGEISEIYIPEDAVKNNSRPRKIALNSTARWAVEQCYKRALKLGVTEPDHYLFPFRVHLQKWDAAKPASRSWLRNSWQKLRMATGFHQLAPHDLRHHCITRLLENDVEPETVRAIAGHVTSKMMEYYAHHRRRVRYAAVLAIDSSFKNQTAKRKPPLKETLHPDRANANAG